MMSLFAEAPNHIPRHTVLYTCQYWSQWGTVCDITDIYIFPDTHIHTETLKFLLDPCPKIPQKYIVRLPYMVTGYPIWSQATLYGHRLPYCTWSQATLYGHTTVMLTNSQFFSSVSQRDVRWQGGKFSTVPFQWSTLQYPVHFIYGWKSRTSILTLDIWTTVPPLTVTEL